VVETANELRLPVGRTVELSLRSPDVIHSFWVPGLAGKMDMIPGRTNRLVVRATKAGTYRGVCAEFCGLGHALMAFDVVPSEAAGWGAMYVVEGSRLGGILLSRSVPEGMPSAYLGSKHLSGEWRALLAAIDDEPADDAWVERAIVGAKAAFDLYRRAPA